MHLEILFSYELFLAKGKFKPCSSEVQKVTGRYFKKKS